ncbi:MAG: 30S ribosomal protein S2 [Saprospiraceae bacterium]
MAKPTYQELLDAGVHFGHLKRKWNPKMAKYIFAMRKGIHIIDLNRTGEEMDRAGRAMKQLARSGKKILFVATKKQARDVVATVARECNQPFVTDRWLGGMLTNWQTIRRSVRKMQSIDNMLSDTSLSSITKKERLMLTRERAKLERVLGGISELNRVPSAIFMVDITHEHIALAESKRLGLRTFAMVDTNSDPTTVDFPIPANDDASKSIEIVCRYLSEFIIEGHGERETQKAERETAAAAEAAAKATAAAAAKKAAAAAKAAATAAAAAAAPAPAAEGDAPAAE